MPVRTDLQRMVLFNFYFNISKRFMHFFFKSDYTSMGHILFILAIKTNEPIDNKIGLQSGMFLPLVF